MTPVFAWFDISPGRAAIRPPRRPAGKIEVVLHVALCHDGLAAWWETSEGVWLGPAVGGEA